MSGPFFLATPLLSFASVADREPEKKNAMKCAGEVLALVDFDSEASLLLERWPGEKSRLDKE
jgi:hypothetical protein